MILKKSNFKYHFYYLQIGPAIDINKQIIGNKNIVIINNLYGINNELVTKLKQQDFFFFFFISFLFFS